MVDHPFGGPWTEIKLDAVQYYLECYAKALTPKKFDLWLCVPKALSELMT